MENYGALKIIFSISILVLSVPVLAYSPDTTHQMLSSESAKLFNKYYPSHKISESDIRLIMQGSHDEDAFGRWMHHFYDPVYDRGLSFGVRWESSKRWAQDHKLQSKYDAKTLAAGALLRPFSASSDYSWERSVYEYAWGDKKRGLKGLGQVLHLIQDAAVPEHTRDDPHPPLFEMGSPYEGWTAQFGVNNTDIVSVLSVPPPTFNSLKEYFYSIASYSNNNFFSKDTIFESRYNNPTVSFQGEEFLSNGLRYRFGYSQKGFRLVKVKPGTNWTEPVYSIDDPDNLIHSDYWNLLSKQAVLYGAGVIRLFFEEVEKEKQTEKLFSYNQSPFDRAMSALSTFFSPTKKLQQNNILTSNLEFKDEYFNPRPVQLEQVQSQPQLERVEVNNQTVQDLEQESEPEFTPPPQIQPQTFQESIAQAQTSTPPIINRPSGSGGGGITHLNPSVSSSNSSQPSQGQDQDVTLEPPNITTPSDFSQTFTSTSITFSGASTPNSIITNSFSSQAATSSTSGDWSVMIENLNQGTSTISFFASDGSSQSDPKTVSLFIDSLGPDLSGFTISECSNSLASNGCLLIEKNLSLSWGGSDDAVSYKIECVTCGSGFPITTNSTSTNIVLENEGLHTLVLKGYDSLDNESSLSSQQIEINSSPVVINEIAWMGAKSSASDEWMELFNTSSFSINLGDGVASTSWSLASTDGTPSIILNSEIESSGFFILERTSSTTTAFQEHQIYTGALNNSGEELELRLPDGTLIDYMDANPSTMGWTEGDNAEKRTMERINPYSSGIIYNWDTSTATSTILDAGGNNILGTPGERNSVYQEEWSPTFVGDSFVINTDTTWGKYGSPYLLDSNSGAYPTIAAGATLTIEPGVVLMALSDDHSALRVEGTLKAIGSAGEEVIFTFFSDEDYGGQESGQKGIWKGIEFGSTSADSQLEHVRIRYAGAGAIPEVAIKIEEGAGVSFNNSTFEENQGIIFNLDGSGFNNISITNSLFKENGIPALADDAAIVTKNGASPIVEGNTFSNNSYHPITINSSYPSVSQNTATGNFRNGILVKDDTNISLPTTWNSSIPYILEANSGQRTTIASSSSLTISPGVVIKAQSPHEVMRVEGELNWQAIPGQPGIFTSIYDDSFGGDTENNSTSTVPTIGDWAGINFAASSTANISNVQFLYGTGGSDPDRAGLIIDSTATVNLDSVIFGP